VSTRIIQCKASTACARADAHKLDRKCVGRLRARRGSGPRPARPRPVRPSSRHS